MNQPILLLVLAVLLAVPVVLNIRRQQTQLKAAQTVQNGLQVGDQVVTGAGVHATVQALTETTVELEIAPGVSTTWERRAILRKINDTH